jgi:hypothetical protein
VLEFGSSKNSDEDGTNSDWAKVASEKSFSPGFDVRYDGLQDHHDGNAPEENDKDCQDDKPPRAQWQFRAVKLTPRNDGAEVDKVCQVDEQINNVGYVRLLSLLSKPAVV